MAVGTSRKPRKPAAKSEKATVSPDPVPLSSGDRVLELRILPGGLDHYLAMVGDGGGNPRFKCYDGSLLLVSPSNAHELAGEHAATLVLAICSILRIRCRTLASTTLWIPGTNKGIEPDKGFYIQNFEAVQGHKDIDLAVVPPPDLIVEIVDTHPPTRSLAFARDFGIPEVWVYNVRKQKVEILILKRAGKHAPTYEKSESSLAFLYLSTIDVSRWMSDGEIDHAELDRKLRKWIRTELAPRVKSQKKPKS